MVQLAHESSHGTSVIKRLHVVIRGAVQGVGFRPFVYRLAHDLQLTGWVINSPSGVHLEVEGERASLDCMLLRLEREKPAHSFVQSLEYSILDPAGYTSFEIRQSEDRGDPSTLILPDIATCQECLQEIFDPRNRRFLYPFTNCTHCGPRFSIIESLPYDRKNTTMKEFTMCAACRSEYENPLDRRFHAQPIACPRCGPHLELWDSAGEVLAMHHEALVGAAESVRCGNIVALKGLGGFQFIVDARDEVAVRRLRSRKHREEKPFAVMFPSLNLLKHECEVSELEGRLLRSSESPIVLLQRKTNFSRGGSLIAPSVAPRNPYLGVMLPYTPLHHVLMREIEFPIVATSGNLTDEPICLDEFDAVHRLHEIADVLLVHNRPIKRHVDDSVTRVLMGRELVLRRARGYAPLPIQLHAMNSNHVLAGGAQLKNTIAVASGDNVFLSQHIGDLETKEAFDAYKSTICDFKTLFKLQGEKSVCDMHPRYLSTKHLRGFSAGVESVQHHHAHVASCMAENQLEGNVLGVAWDGTGYGLDGTIWGGEFLLTNEGTFRRVASFRQFRLPGGESAIKNNWRTALAMYFEMFGRSTLTRNDLLPPQIGSPEEHCMIVRMLEKQINSPLTSSVGRLFDAVASMIGLRQHISFEGQAAMEMEFLTDGIVTDEVYPFQSNVIDPKPTAADQHAIDSKPGVIIDWAPMILSILDDIKRKIPCALISTKFHNSLTEIIVEIARIAGNERIVLSGGCFQNKYLSERSVTRLEAEGFKVYWHQRVPPNDGGIALGQIYALMMRRKAESDRQPAPATPKGTSVCV